VKTKRNLIQIWLLCAAVLLQAVTSGAQPVTKVAAGAWHSLFVKSDGSLWAMGYNQYGELGDGTYNNTNQPEQILASNVAAIAAGCCYHSLFVKSDGSLWAMGDNSSGQLGNGTTSYGTNLPDQIVTSNVTTIAGGFWHSLFVKSDGSLWAMGDNFYGELGNGTYHTTNQPEQILASNVTAIAGGEYHSLFLKSDGSLWAMGYNYYGQLGNGTRHTTNQPEQIVASNVTAIAAGCYHSLFLKGDGSLWAMGYNYYGQLGDGSYNDTHLPEQIVASNVTAIAAGCYHSLFLKSDGSLWAMGWNTYGQLGDGTTNNADLPEQIVSPSTLPPFAAAYTWTTFAGNASAGEANGTGTNAQFGGPAGVAVDSAGNVYVADMEGSTIREVTPAGAVTTLAGAGGPWGTNDGTGSAAQFFLPEGVTVDSAGNVYVADTSNHTIRKVTPVGTNWVVTTLAGLGGALGTNDGTGSAARFSYPGGVAVDTNGNIYVADSENHTIRELTPAGVVTTLAGLAGVRGTNDGTGSAARFNNPSGVAVDTNGNIYVADSYNNAIRTITPAGVVTTIAGLPLFTVIGNPVGGSADGMNSSARFSFPAGVAVDSAGNVYVADEDNNTIRKMIPEGSNWMVSTIGGVAGFNGSTNGSGSVARFFGPGGVAVDSAGNVYVADSGNNMIRKGVATANVPVNAVSYSPPTMNSSLTVTLLPPEAIGQWRFAWELGWHRSGDTVSNLVAGKYPVEFGTLSGWLAIPPSLTVAVPTNSIVAITNQYYPTISTVDTNNGGTLTVTLGPNPPSGAGWGFLGNSPPWYPSGYSTNLVAGTYLIEFAPVSGRVTPPNLAVQVQAGLPTLLAENYLLAQSAPGGVLLPTPVPPANISDLTDYPFGFNGQLETDVGYGSGVAVQASVVLTAAHLVFNDQTLSYVSQAYWYSQEEAGVFEPEPLAARGWYVLSGYAEQRTNDLEVYAPDTSTPQSRNWDVAALYFLSPVAGPGGGYGGYLPSDESPNPWLTSTALKMLVGYPVDGSQLGDATIVPGEMYQIGPQPYPLTLDTEQVTNQQEVYTASWFLSYPGNSGGPLYVQYNGYYYPAGVYLGTLYNGTTPYASAVRAIDIDVVNLITIAANPSDTGTTFAQVVIQSLAGVTTVIPNQAISTNNLGYVQIQMAPPAAVVAGAAWSVSGLTGLDLEHESWATNYWATNWTVVAYTTNGFQVNFKVIPGWNVPPSQVVTLIPTVVVTNLGYYTVTNPVLLAGKSVGLGITGTTGTVYQLQRRTNLTSGSWLPVSTNTIRTNGFNLLLPQPATNGNAFFYRAVWLGY